MILIYNFMKHEPLSHRHWWSYQHVDVTSEQSTRFHLTSFHAFKNGVMTSTWLTFICLLLSCCMTTGRARSIHVNLIMLSDSLLWLGHKQRHAWVVIGARICKFSTIFFHFFKCFSSISKKSLNCMNDGDVFTLWNRYPHYLLLFDSRNGFDECVI